ncbi:hypothetical protein MBH78_15105 [Oceanimonas sp. NS1]|nr:hypothetical protein [Oceanimonas sp. NS1]
MTERTHLGTLQVATVLHDLVVNEIIPGTGVEPAAFWSGMEQIVNDLAPKNRALLEKRDALQQRSTNGTMPTPASLTMLLPTSNS